MTLSLLSTVPGIAAYCLMPSFTIHCLDEMLNNKNDGNKKTILISFLLKKKKETICRRKAR